jgi:hypothetical protein
MSKEVQSKFSKDGLKGKRPFKKTKHYSCLVGKATLFLLSFEAYLIQIFFGWMLGSAFIELVKIF